VRVPCVARWAGTLGPVILYLTDGVDTAFISETRIDAVRNGSITGPVQGTVFIGHAAWFGWNNLETFTLVRVSFKIRWTGALEGPW